MALWTEPDTTQYAAEETLFSDFLVDLLERVLALFSTPTVGQITTATGISDGSTYVDVVDVWWCFPDSWDIPSGYACFIEIPVTGENFRDLPGDPWTAVSYRLGATGIPVTTDIADGASGTRLVLRYPVPTPVPTGATKLTIQSSGEISKVTRAIQPCDARMVFESI